MARRLASLDDQRLAERVRRGDEAAFEVLYERHHRALLSFCRHMLGNAEDGEDALQQTFLRAHKALVAGPPPDAVRPWLFAIARNRCRTLLAARREAAVPVDELEPSFDGLADDVAVRADLRELVADLARLPADQREALVLFELGGLSQAEIASTIGVPAGKVKALVYQARTELMAERDARSTPCAEIRSELAVARGGALRRGPLRRHLRNCEPCQAYKAAVAAQREGLAAILPVAPAAGLKASVLAAVLGAEGGATVAGGVAATMTKVAALVAIVGAGAGAGAVAERVADKPAGARAVATVVASPSPTPTATPSPTSTPAATRTPRPVERARPKRGRVTERRTPTASKPAPTATATPRPVRTVTAKATPVATPVVTVAAKTVSEPPPPKRERQPPPVTGVVLEEPPPPPPADTGPVTGEVVEPAPAGEGAADAVDDGDG